MTDYKTSIKYGWAELRSWLEWRDGKLVGMCSKTEYGRLGKIELHKVEPTGIEVTLA